MCQDVRKTCECGRHRVQFLLRDNIMVPEVIHRLFCPECRGDKKIDEESTIFDNSWAIEFDLVLARSIATSKLHLSEEDISPEFLFDSGYVTWLELYPGEKEAIEEERKNIIKLMAKDQRKYLETIQRWNIDRVEQLRRDGWRKAQNAT